MRNAGVCVDWRQIAGSVTLVILAAATLPAQHRPDFSGRAEPSPSVTLIYRRQSGIAQTPTKPDTHLISAAGIGGIRLDTTVGEARRALPAAKFARTSDGDGAAFVEVILSAGESIVLWAEEEDPKAAIDWSKRIKRVETFSPAFHTAEGVRVGTFVTDVEKLLGKTMEIQRSEIESREYITFERQPAYLTFRLNYTGIFSGELRKTQQFAPGAKILSIAVSAQRAPPAGLPAASAEVETFVREALADRLAAGDIPDIRIARPEGATRFSVRADLPSWRIRITSRALPSVPGAELAVVTFAEAQETATRTWQSVRFVVVDYVRIEGSKGTLWLGAGLVGPPGTVVLCCCEREAHFERRDGRWLFERWGHRYTCK